MSTLLGMLGISWHWLAALLAIAVALITSWFGGKKIGKTEGQAQEQVKAQQEKTAQVIASARDQAKKSEVLKNAQNDNAGADDAAARNKLRDTSWNTRSDRDPPAS